MHFINFRALLWMIWVPIIIGVIGLVGISQPVLAQDGASIFATNTPINDTAPAGLFATNTPVEDTAPAGLFATSTPIGESAPSGILATNTPLPVGLPSATPTLAPTIAPTAGPAQALDFYALRMWLEPDLIAMIQNQLATLAEDGDDGQLALRISQYELRARVPGAPTNPADLAELINVLRQSPRGTVDMRPFVRPYILAEMNRRGGLLNFEYDGFAVNIQGATLNNDNFADAIVEIRYPATATTDDDLLLKDTMLIAQISAGNFVQIPQTFDLTPYPFDGVVAYDWVAVGDVNRDSLDEVAVALRREGQINSRLHIIGVRNGEALDLTAPNEAILFGEIIRWNYDDPTITEPSLVVQELQPITRAPDWVCNAEQSATWQFDNNFFRRQSAGLNASYQPQDNLGCTLLDAEPLFDKELREAIEIVEEAIDAYATDTANQARANLTLAMLYALNGQLEIATTIAQQVIDENESGSWASVQGQALIDATMQSGTTALGICEAMVRFSEDASCRINDLLNRYLALITLNTDEDLLTQLEFYGFPISESLVVSEVGRAERIIVNFAFARAGWWGFRADRNGTYIPERTEAPAGFEEAILPRGFTEAPPSAFNALIINRDPSGALNILATLEQNNPQTPLSYSARYLRALSYDLVGDRQQARRLYYELWQTVPERIWGRLAAEHLESRQ